MDWGHGCPLYRNKRPAVAHLDITNIHCIKTRDPIGKSEFDLYLALDGGSEQFVSGPHFLDKSENDDDVTLNIHRLFNERAVVRLRERDGDRGGNNDLDMGSDGFGAAVQEARDISFSGNNGRVLCTVRIGVSA
jgi:hypothetical protein